MEFCVLLPLYTSISSPKILFDLLKSLVACTYLKIKSSFFFFFLALQLSSLGLWQWKCSLNHWTTRESPNLACLMQPTKPYRVWPLPSQQLQFLLPFPSNIICSSHKAFTQLLKYIIYFPPQGLCKCCSFYLLCSFLCCFLSPVTLVTFHWLCYRLTKN